MSDGLPKIAKDAQRVRAAINQMVMRMSRFHRYRAGSDLVAAAKAVVMAALRTWHSTDGKEARARELREAVDLLYLELQSGKDDGAYRSWAEFEAVVLLVEDVRQQSGRWRKSLQVNGQSARADQPPGQRASTLSSRSAPHAGASP